MPEKTRAFFHEPGAKACVEGPVHIVDIGRDTSTTGLKMLCGAGKPPSTWEYHLLEDSDGAVIAMSMCAKCLANDICRFIEDPVKREEAVDKMLGTPLDADRYSTVGERSTVYVYDLRRMPQSHFNEAGPYRPGRRDALDMD